MKINKNKYSNSVSYKIDAKERDYLYIKNSQISNSGSGLYTAIFIYKDEVISLFKGEIINRLEAKNRSKKGKDAYFINLLDGSILDSMEVNCFAKYANDALGIAKSKFKINSKISLDENDNVCIVALRDVKVGEEIFCSYGKSYWENFKKRIFF
ncbi:MAG: SET domain-containing protein [Bacteroidetes bacterium]|nr:SET domain-containing protein [Bacteroidota bacterium]